jgi:hypothetical protein
MITSTSVVRKMVMNYLEKMIFQQKCERMATIVFGLARLESNLINQTKAQSFFGDEKERKQEVLYFVCKKRCQTKYG